MCVYQFRHSRGSGESSHPSGARLYEQTFAPMHQPDTIRAALDLAAGGSSATDIARRLAIPRSTVRDWLAGKAPNAQRQREAAGATRPERLPDVYAYLLGIYLGDGCLSAAPRGVFKLRLFLDAKYPGIVEECVAAIEAIRPGSKIGVLRRGGGRWLEVYAYWKAWPVLFPQHGPGRKHNRRIVLEPWQEQLVALDPDLLLRGLIQSDGCRFMNTGRKGWRHPRYSFSNRSADIRAIFCAACERLDLRWTAAPHTVYVSRKEDVWLLDQVVGPKA